MKQIISIGEILFDFFAGDKKLGGAPFNFIYHIINLTGYGIFISRIGEDKPGEDILKFLNSHKISPHYIQTDTEHPTGEAVAKLNNSKIPEWIIVPDSAYDFIELTEELTELISKNAVCIYFGTLAQRNNESRKSIQSLFKQGLKYFCDLNIRQNYYTKEIIEESLRAANVVKLNLNELNLIENLFYNHFAITSNLDDTAKLVIKTFNIELLCVTMGEQGAALFNHNESHHYRVMVKNEEIIDTIGAGDAYAAILCIGYLKNWNIKKINTLACEFASEIIRINGALPSDNSVYLKYRKKMGKL
jgi:fructokinase